MSDVLTESHQAYLHEGQILKGPGSNTEWGETSAFPPLTNAVK